MPITIKIEKYKLHTKYIDFSNKYTRARLSYLTGKCWFFFLKGSCYLAKFSYKHKPKWLRGRNAGILQAY